MITVERQTMHTIPYLHIVKNEARSRQKPTIFFIHGFTSAKEHNLHYAYLYAEKGYRVILPDAPLHGERDEGLDETTLSTRFWNMVIKAIHEVELIKNELCRQELIDESRIGLAGTSMGGIITLGALTQYDWIKVGVSLMGSPAYVGFAQAQIDHFKKNGFTLPMSEEEIQHQLQTLASYDLSLHKEKLNNRPLLFWHGTADTVVPFGPTYAFYKSILPDYESHPEHLRFITEEGEGHKVSREGLLQSVTWFERYL
ncbi:alpha/beta fold hydrolase [Jeotgalibacillus soli]|uniref:Peptidase YitV n=1 Tax=Jeotgalibacillus soli TaxID=889306 RepID=A0A0C2VMK0_9BACL|nr:alpha/beta fold hydrolase [Jeotgalibacillus soli]KIL45666.1 peptidase YitV [Jeotgalibacillus soli]